MNTQHDRIEANIVPAKNRIPVLDVAQPSRLRKRGCFQVIAILVCSPENKEKPISIQQSWLPLFDQQFNDTPQTRMRIDNVIPVLKETNNTINKMMPTLRKYAVEHNHKWVILPVPFLYRPSILNNKIYEDKKLEALISQDFFNQIPIEDRVLLSLLPGINDAQAYKKLIEISLSTLTAADIDIASYGIDLSKHNREIARDFLVKFPFLVYHIFDQLKNLHVLRYDALIDDREETIEFIRYEPEYFQGIINRKYLLDDISHVTT